MIKVELSSGKDNPAVTQTRSVQPRNRSMFSQITPKQSSQKLYNKVLAEASQHTGAPVVHRVDLNTGAVSSVTAQQAKSHRLNAVSNAMSGIEQRKGSHSSGKSGGPIVM